MELVTYRFQRKMRDHRPLVIAPIGDIQWSGERGPTAKDTLRRHIDRCLERDAWYVGLGDYCLGVDAEILTRRGFKRYDELISGESVAAYDGREIVWTPLLGLYLNPSAPFLELKSKSFKMRCTPSHDWWVVEPFQRRIPGTRKNRLDGLTSPKKVAARDLRAGHRIIVAAQCMEKGVVDMTPDEAALLGWLVTDGHIVSRRGGATFSIGITQKKEPYRSEIRRRFAGWITKEYGLARTEDCSTFNISVKKVRHLCTRLGLDLANLKAALPSLVCSLGPSARREMLTAMLQAEGWQEHSRWRFSQKPGPVLEAFKILATLSGERLGLGKFNRAGVRTLPLLGSRPVGVADLTIKDVGEGPAWCPQTGYRSWVCRLGDQVAITGNTDFMSPSNRQRIKAAALYDTAEDVIDDKALDLVWEVYEKFLKPTKGRWLGMLEGHHFAQLKTGETTDQRLCQLLDAKFLGTSAYIRLIFKQSSTEGNVVLWAHHGCGGGLTAGAPLNRLERSFSRWEGADVFLMGHTTKAPADRIPRPYPRWNGHGAPDLVHRDVLLVNTGGFSKSYVVGSKQGRVPRGGYAEQRMLQPSSVGAPLLLIQPYRRYRRSQGFMHGHNGEWAPEIRVEL